MRSDEQTGHTRSVASATKKAGAAIAGILAFIGVALAGAQLWQSELDSREQDSANQTVVAVLRDQYRVLGEMATLQSSEVDTGPTGTAAAQELVQLEGTAEVLEQVRLRAEATLLPSSGTTPTTAFPPALPPVTLSIFTNTGQAASHSKAEVEVPSDYKILGGGARVNWTSYGNLLTSSYPENLRKWVATSKDHGVRDPSTITVWAVAIHDPSNQWDVRIFSQTSLEMNHPYVAVSVPDDYTMVGGGAQVHWTGSGNLLTASYPVDLVTWEARGKDHSYPSPAKITAYAIGIRANNGAMFPATKIFRNSSSRDQHPRSTVRVEDGFVLLCGGVLVEWEGAGNLLTASYPADDRSWTGASKDHVTRSPAILTVYALGAKIDQ